MNTVERGPYMNDDGQFYWYPVDAWIYNEARRDAASEAQNNMGDWGRSQFVKKVMAGCHDHDEPWDGDCCQRLCYQFEMYEGTWRR